MRRWSHHPRKGSQMGNVGSGKPIFWAKSDRAYDMAKYATKPKMSASRITGTAKTNMRFAVLKLYMATCSSNLKIGVQRYCCPSFLVRPARANSSISSGSARHCALRLITEPTKGTARRLSLCIGLTKLIGTGRSKLTDGALGPEPPSAEASSPLSRR